MCVMGLVKPGQNFTPEHIEQIYHRGNRDGFGLAYVEGERYEDGPKKGQLVRPGRVKIVKSMGLSMELKELYKKQLDLQVPFVFHLRNATAGDKVVDNCHPYQILSIDEDDPIDLWLFHNGTIRQAWLDKAKSDSRNFAENHLRGLLRPRPSMLYEDGFRNFLATMVDNNKFILLDNRERVSIINHDLGSYHPGTGVWLSTKENILPYVPYRAPVTTQRNFGFGAGPDTTRTTTPVNSETATSSAINLSKPRFSWIAADGSKWILSADGRSHYLPKEINTKPDDSVILLPAGDAESNDEVIKGLMEKASPPKTPAEYEAARADLAKMSQFQINEYVKEFPIESAYLLRYGAGLWPDTLPEFTEMTIENIAVYCIESDWNAAYALGFMSRQKMKETVHEVN